MRNLAAEFGNIDIYLFDQLLKGRISATDRVLDAGCGSGRNAYYLLTQDVDVYAVDANPAAVAGVRELAIELGRPADPAHFRVEPLEALTFDSGSFDVVICSAVLHFARDDDHFEAMMRELWRVLSAQEASSSPASRRLSGWNHRCAKLPAAASRCPMGRSATSWTNNSSWRS